MRRIPIGAVPCLLAMQAVAQTPLTFGDIQSKVRPTPEQWRTQAMLAEHRLQLQESKGFMREGPTVSVSAGPRRTPGAGSATDKGFEVDLPLFLSPKVRSGLESSLGKAHPLLLEAAQRESALRLRATYLDAWLASRLLALQEADLATVEHWLKAAQARFEAGADPAFQVALIEGERLKLQQDLDEARMHQAQTWGALVALADLPIAPSPLADPGPAPALDAIDLERRLQESPLRKALLAQVELDTQSLRLKEAQALNRWSLRGSFAQEGEDQVARLGVAVRLPRPGERASIRHNTEAQVQAIRGEARQALAELDARALSARSRVEKAPNAPAPPDFMGAIEAVGLRLQEGRERPSEALPIRRQLLEAQMASLRRLHAQHLLSAELQTLLPEVRR